MIQETLNSILKKIIWYSYKSKFQLISLMKLEQFYLY